MVLLLYLSSVKNLIALLIKDLARLEADQEAVYNQCHKHGECKRDHHYKYVDVVNQAVLLVA